MVFTPKDHIRDEDNTFLTLPEWYLVHSPEEYALFIKTERPSKFPFFGHIRQFWETYHMVYKATKGKYKFNGSYHLMVMTIGLSTTFEYTVKGIYEVLFGNLTECRCECYRTPEDEYAAKIANDYVEFIKVQPWYKYDFMSALNGLWQNTSKKQGNNLRKLERRCSLSTEYLAKAGYGWVIKKATQASFDTPIPETAVTFKIIDPDTINKLSGVKTTKHIGEDTYLSYLPRYGEFTKAAEAISDAGGEFMEIAGNKKFIMVSFITPTTFDKTAIDAELKLIQPILTNNTMQRAIYLVDIPKLSAILSYAKCNNIKVEHIYDF